jgi:1-acyl-sn-glycerol-3-phosphate acyltransferase
LSPYSTDLPIPHAGHASRILRFAGAVRSSAYLFTFTIYISAVMGLAQRLVIWPAILLLPSRRRSIVRAWLGLQARVTLALARAIANVRVSVQGSIGSESCIVVMNHQSVLDIPIGISLVRGPYPLIPTRDRYQRGIPGISPLVRLARFPVVSQKRSISRAELAGLTSAADQVARGEQSLLIFPEGHRSRDGKIGRFMRSGLRIVLTHAKRPVYCVVASGIQNARTFADVLVSFANLDVRVAVLGPLAPPDDDSVDDFIDSLHDRMTLALAELEPESCHATPIQQIPSAADSVADR